MSQYADRSNDLKNKVTSAPPSFPKINGTLENRVLAKAMCCRRSTCRAGGRDSRNLLMRRRNQALLRAKCPLYPQKRTWIGRAVVSACARSGHSLRVSLTKRSPWFFLGPCTIFGHSKRKVIDLAHLSLHVQEIRLVLQFGPLPPLPSAAFRSGWRSPLA